jgi:hypothetical protein
MNQRLSFGSGLNYQEEDAVPAVDEDYGGLDDNHSKQQSETCTVLQVLVLAFGTRRRAEGRLSPWS